MTVQELITRFPEIPRDLHDEPALAEFAESFDDLLRVARDPVACSSQYDAANHYYLKLIGPLKTYMYGLCTREKVLGQIKQALDRHRDDPEGFASSLLPEEAVASEVRGPGCA